MRQFSVPMVSETVEETQVNRNRDIRNIIKTALQDDEFCAEILHLIMPAGVTGSVTMDKGIACYHILNKTDLRERYQLTESLCWDHLGIVLRGLGYIMDKGRLVGHKAIAYKTEEEPANDVEPTVEPQPNVA